MTRFDVLDTLERIRKTDGLLIAKGIPDDWKYLRLYEWFSQCQRKKGTLAFSEIEMILGFPLTDSQKSSKWHWYKRKDSLNMPYAWLYQGYALKRLVLANQRAVFEATVDDLEKVEIPPEIIDRKVPKKAKYEIEHFLRSMVKKYGLSLAMP